MNPLKKLLSQSAIYGLSSIVGRLLNYLLVPLYTSAFANPSDYGVVSELYAYVAFLVVLLTFGMETSFFRFIQVKEDKNEVFQKNIQQKTPVFDEGFEMFIYVKIADLATNRLLNEEQSLLV